MTNKSISLFAAVAAVVPSMLSAAELSADYQFKLVKLGGGGYVTGIQIHPDKDGPVYARTDVGGVYKWDTSTSQWKQLIVADAIPGEVLAEEAEDTGDGLLGAEFRRVSLYQTEAIGIAPSDPNILFVAAGGLLQQPGTLLKSTDGGATFARMNLTVPMSGNSEFRFFNERLAVKPDDANIVLFGSRKNGLQRSTDSGLNWAAVESVPVGNKVDNVDVGVGPVTFDPSAPDVAYCSVADTGIFRSEDGGATWKKISDEWADRMDCSQGVLYISRSTQGAKKFTADAGWTSIDPKEDKNIAAIAADPANAQRVYAMSTGGQNLYRSLDGGETWTKLTPSSRNAEGRESFQSKNIPWIENSNVRDWLSIGTLVFDPRRPDTLWLTEGMAVWKSDDATETNENPIFNNVSQGIEELVATDVLASPGGKISFLTLDRVGFHRTNATLDTFPDKQLGLSQKFDAGISLAASGGNPEFLVASVADERVPPVRGGYAGWGVRSGFSTDGGDTWERFKSIDQTTESNNPETLMFGEIVVDTKDTNNLVWLPRLPHWFIKDGKGAYNTKGNPDDAQHIYHSTDRGATWAIASTGDHQDRREEYLNIKRSLAADTALPGTFYAYDLGGRIFASTDSGVTWTAICEAGTLPAHTYANVLRAAPANAGHLWFASGWDYRAGESNQGFFRSTDGGKSWSKLPGFTTTWQFGFGKPKAEGGYPTLFVYGCYEGEWSLYRSTDEGASWDFLVKYPLGIFAHVTTVAGDPNVFGRVYLGWGGNGFAYGSPKAETGSSKSNE